jgi:hypothetical protein
MKPVSLLTFVISMLMFLIVALICGNLIRSLLSFIISVDFCKDPVTLTIACKDVEVSPSNRQRSMTSAYLVGALAVFQ